MSRAQHILTLIEAGPWGTTRPNRTVDDRPRPDDAIPYHSSNYPSDEPSPSPHYWNTKAEKDRLKRDALGQKTRPSLADLNRQKDDERRALMAQLERKKKAWQNVQRDARPRKKKKRR